MTTIGHSFVVHGEITSDEAVTIHGHVKGQVLVRDGPLVIEEEGQVDAAIRGVRIVISGTVRGAVSATEHLDLRASARVTGSLSANQVVIADGARFNGQVDMGRRTIAAVVAQFKERSAAQ